MTTAARERETPLQGYDHHHLQTGAQAEDDVGTVGSFDGLLPAVGCLQTAFLSKVHNGVPQFCYPSAAVPSCAVSSDARLLRDVKQSNVLLVRPTGVAFLQM